MLVELDRVTRVYGGAPPVSVLRDLSLAIDERDSLAIVGPSGSGKSTILNLLGGLDRPSAGRVRFEGRDVAALDEEELARLRNRRIGFVFQDHHLLPQCSVWENVLVPTLVEGTTPAELERARGLLDRVGLSDRLAHRPGTLSGGERQRVAVVRALIRRPALLLADEPTGALDRAAAEEIGRLLVEAHREEGVALVVVTHSGELAARMARRLRLRDGGLAEEPA